MAGNPLVSGSAMSVLLGTAAIASSILPPGITLADRLTLLFIGVILLLLGLLFSQG